MEKQNLRYTLKNWLKKISNEEIKQEEDILSWSKKELDGYQGLLSFYNLYITYNTKEKRLKKNTLDDKSSVSTNDFNEMILDFVNKQPDSIKSKVCLLLQGPIEEYYNGKKYNSIRKLSKILKIPKSTIHNVIDFVKTKIRY